MAPNSTISVSPGEPVFYIDLVTNHPEEREAWVSALLALLSLSSSPDPPSTKISGISSSCSSSSSSALSSDVVAKSGPYVRHSSISVSSQVRHHNLSSIPSAVNREPSRSRTKPPTSISLHPQFAVPA